MIKLLFLAQEKYLHEQQGTSHSQYTQEGANRMIPSTFHRFLGHICKDLFKNKK